MSRRQQSPEGTSLQGCPDLLRHGQSPLSPFYRSSFEEECRSIAERLRLGAAPSPSSVPWEGSSPWPDGSGFITSTPMGSSLPPVEETLAGPDPDRCQPTAAPSLGEPGCPEAALPAARPLPRPRETAQRGTGQQPRGGPGPAVCPRGRGRVSLIQARISGKTSELPETGTRFQRPSGASQLPQPSTIPKAVLRNTGRGKATAKIGGRRPPSERLPAAVPTLAYHSRPRPLGKASSPKRFCPGLPAQEPICNTTWELTETCEKNECLVAVGTVPGAGRPDQKCVYGMSSFSSGLAPGLAPHPGSGDADPAEQAAGGQLSRELKHLKNELEQIKGNLADSTARLEACEQMISSMVAKLRAAEIHPEDTEVEESSNVRKG